ncbi:unnamed protein product [Haemonchus placei]|uniref:Chromo domain-containing protein n=1 Tax=Haemonchus placei TaxID=6290 RepID=A0A0N4X0B3_HAEPC|nr:unnamed protein product [Haemonchus placei]
MEYNVGDVVRCMWGSKPVEYEAKIVRANFASKEYFVHYQGWNKRYDEWISEKSILGASKKQQTPSRCDTPKIRHSRRGAAENTRANDQVTSSTRRVHILPVRKPLDIEYTLPYSPSAFKFAKVSSSSLIAKPPMIAPTRPRVDHPPNLGSPFTYCDEYHSSSPISMECNAKGICGERAIAASNFLNVDISDSVTTSSSYSESEDSLSSRQQITGPKSVSPFTVST